MKTDFRAFFTVAKELAELAKSSMPEIRKGETIKREWLQDGVYYRETVYDGKIHQARFDFRQRKIFI